MKQQPNSSTRYLVVKGKAGLGNRIPALAHAIFYALISRRTLMVDWSDYTYSHDGENVFSEFFTLEGVSHTDVDWPSLESLSVSPRIWKGRLEMSVNELLRRLGSERRPGLGIMRSLGRIYRYLHMHDTGCAANVRVMWAYGEYIAGFPRKQKQAFFGTHYSDEILGIILRKYLKPSSSILAVVDDFVSRHEPMVGVHVRLSDKMPGAPLARCFERVDALRSHDRIFISTDNHEVLEAFQARYGRRVVATDKWYPASSEHAHQNPSCPDRTEHGRSALVDTLILARCEVLLRQQGSSFSRIAGHLSDRGSVAWND